MYRYKSLHGTVVVNELRETAISTARVYKMLVLVTYSTGLAMPGCIQGWIDIPDENITVIKCNDLWTETVEWTLENEAKNQTIFRGFCSSGSATCSSSNSNDIYLQRHSASETSLNIVRNHWSYGGLRLTCSTNTEVTSCITNVIRKMRPLLIPIICVYFNQQSC